MEECKTFSMYYIAYSFFLEIQRIGGYTFHRILLHKKLKSV